MMAQNEHTTLDGVFSRLLRPIIADEIQYQLESFFSRIEGKGAPTHNDDELLNVDQAADYLGCKRQTIYQNAHRIPHSKRLNRLFFTRKDLKSWVAEGGNAPRKKTRIGLSK